MLIVLVVLLLLTPAAAAILKVWVVVVPHPLALSGLPWPARLVPHARACARAARRPPRIRGPGPSTGRCCDVPVHTGRSLKVPLGRQPAP
ncbi:MAG: hypothetical protein J3K34DRAFT_410095 [Monoraphidium minutum]|nr:MAG: hypothetical protein J3K34DRAFT_410095 [Monoraphidium minutum]